MTPMFGLEYVQGYTAALQDTIAVIDLIQFDMKRHRRKQNYKSYRAILHCMLENRTILRENPDAFVRCNDSVEGGYEVYIEGQGHYREGAI